LKGTPRYFYSIMDIVKKDFVSIPPRIKIIVFALFVYTLAWGVLEPLQVIYFSSFVEQYFELGIIFSLFNIMLLFSSIPAGALADRVPPKKLVSLGLLLYPAIGAFYFSATSLISLNVTRLINGLGATLVWVSGESFIRKESPKNKSAETFGFYTTATNLALFSGAIIGAFLVLFFEIRELFLLLFPIPIIAFLITLKIKAEEKKAEEKDETIIRAMEKVLEKDGLGTKEIIGFFETGVPAWYCVLLTFFGGFFYQILLIFIPLTAKYISMSTSEILLLYALMHVPFLLGFLFSEVADKLGKTKIITVGLALSSVSLLLVFLFPQNLVLFITFSLFFGLSLAIIGPSLNGLITDITPKNESGEITGIVNSAYYFGAAVSPLFFGAFADIFGLIPSFLAAGIIAAILAILTIALKGFLRTKWQ